VQEIFYNLDIDINLNKSTMEKEYL